MNTAPLAAHFGICVACLLVTPDSPAQTGTIGDVRHVVILMQENRSFDHYFGSLRGVRGFNDPNALTLRTGNSAFYQPSTNGFVLPIHATNQCLSDVTHSWDSGQVAADSGFWDRWIAAKGAGTMAYFTRDELGFYYSLAESYTICDNYFSSVPGHTTPNRLFAFTGTIDADGASGGAALTANLRPGIFSWTTYPERLQSNSISWRVYQEPVQGADLLNPLKWFAQYTNAQPGNPLYDRGIAPVTNVVAALRADVLAGTLPKVSWIIPSWFYSEHPPSIPAYGQILMKNLLEALASDPAVLNSTVFILTYDENGGFFDHVPPPIPPPGTAGEWFRGQPVGLGVRVPVLIISPWSKGGYVCSQVFDHSSLIQFLEKWTGVVEPNISAWRRRICGDLTTAFDFQHPNPGLPFFLAATPVTCPSTYVAAPPTPQMVPAQETGTLQTRSAPYQRNAICTIDCTNQLFWITMTNSGPATVQFALYANAYRTDGPWHYEVPPNSSVTDVFALTNSTGAYDFTCYGPYVFNRRFAGNLGGSCGLNAASIIDFSLGNAALALQNSGNVPATFVISNALQPGVQTETVVPPGGSLTQTINLAGAHSAYDLTVTSATDPGFLRRLADWSELGELLLEIRPSGTSLLLSWPLWANAFSIESSPSLNPAAWVALPEQPVQTGNKLVVSTRLPGVAMFYRLRLDSK